ncbi:hypothetical protein CYMTET_4898 [Cymbomonas tetramitiformis]|uniref:Myb/SANT-like DNA-binding domain-containing protein n=1 Tax=Cymbomonas tetramitiformis TaxID=36881 RepID=A0AAE0LJL0_9CHLO|nr:hypothetical protein CYMTET_4898 [Cymbomonas tetramitiformis]
MNFIPTQTHTPRPSDNTSKSPQKSKPTSDVVEEPDSEGELGDDDFTQQSRKPAKKAKKAKATRWTWDEASTLWLIDCIERHPNCQGKVNFPKQVKDAWKLVHEEVIEKHPSVGTLQQCKNKWCSLKKRYKEIRDDQQSKKKHTTGTTRAQLDASTYKIFTALHAILGANQASAPSYIIDGAETVHTAPEASDTPSVRTPASGGKAPRECPSGPDTCS